MNHFKNITLEVSLKPFYKTDEDFLRKTCTTIFQQWNELTKNADMISVMLWASDGSEILDYSGNLEDTFEWAKYIGGANRRTQWDRQQDPKGLGLHTTRYLYTPEPPIFTYGILRKLNIILKEIGTKITGKPIRVGATFDPGPEFAVSTFKYQRHPEILKGDTLGRASFVCCYSILHGDSTPYASFPEGIPEGTPFGTFLGRQCQSFLRDLEFDYIWFSNGLGFGSETWGTTGATFDGKQFYPERLESTQQKIVEFWKLFRKECDFPVETRGTNLSVGIDLASDGVNLKKLYHDNFDFLPPPNSPWAALDGDFGLELAGFMSRIACLPEKEEYLFRFYVHDPWWMNSPWIDRYEGEAHDIYLPLAVSRLNNHEKYSIPSHLNLLTVDNSLGEMPDSCPREVTPHLLRALEQAPDQAGPFVWLYPFDEYNDLKCGRISKPFFEDWFIRGAINHGLPLNTVISTRKFQSLHKKELDRLLGSVLITPFPTENSSIIPHLLSYVKNGGTLFLYGSTQNGSQEIKSMLGLSDNTPLSGQLTLNCPDAFYNYDIVQKAEFAPIILHDSLLSDGGISEVSAESEKVLASVQNENGETRTFATRTDYGKGTILWLRGSNGSRMGNGHILDPYTAEESFPQETLFRLFIRQIGWDIRFCYQNHTCKTPILLVHRHNNGFFFSTYSPNTTVETHIKTPYGAPLLLAKETVLQPDGSAVYHFSRAERHECRVFVCQNNGVVKCREIPPVSFQARRRIEVSGLQNADIVYFPKTGLENHTEMLLNATYPYQVGIRPEVILQHRPEGVCFIAKNLTGTLTISDILETGIPDREFDE